MTTTEDIIRCANDVTAALANLSHLPPFESIGFSATGASLGLTTTYRPWEKLLPIAQWAYAFGVPVEISLTAYSGSGWVNTHFELAGFRVRITEMIGTAHAYELGAILHKPLSQDGPLTITAKRLQAIISAKTAAVAL